MRRKHTAAILGIMLLGAILVVPSTCAAQGGQKPILPDKYKQWLEAEVGYIIAPLEREVFLKLRTDRERDLFIEAFWKHRDPTPGTPENEFKREHYRRIDYANRFLGRDAVRPGWRTDRGRFYIILGEPRDIQRFEGKSSTYDAEVWFYQDMTEIGLPAGFNLVFFRKGGNGEYKLYSPLSDGPQALLTGYSGGPDYGQAYEALRDVEPSLAAVSLSLVPGESGDFNGRPSLSSDMLIKRIESTPARSIEAKYAQKFLQYKDLVDVEYTANYLESDSLFKVFRDPSGLYSVHYAVEPRRLSVNQYQNKFYTTLKINGRVTAADGCLVYQFDKTVPLNLTGEQMNEANLAPFDFQDLIPLVGGDYSLSILIKNEASKEFMSVDQALRIPQPGAAVELTQPLLGYRVVRLEPGQRRIKAFRIGPYQIYCQPNRAFTRHDTLAVAFQLNGLAPKLAAGCEVKTEFLKDGQPFREIRRKAEDYPELPNALEEVSLADFTPAHYSVRVSIANAGVKVISSSEEFDLSFAESIARPWFSSRSLPDAGDPVYAEIIGSQLFNLGRYEEARVFLERAFERKPESEEAAAGLAKAYLILDNAPAAAKILIPFIDQSKTPKYETHVLAAEALKRTGQVERAIALLSRAVSEFGINAALMNSIGECYTSLGKTREALRAFEKSLELSPDQPAVRKRVDELKKLK